MIVQVIRGLSDNYFIRECLNGHILAHKLQIHNADGLAWCNTGVEQLIHIAGLRRKLAAVDDGRLSVWVKNSI